MNENENTNTPDVNRASGAAGGFVIASGIFVVLVAVVKFSVCPPAIDADRATAISQSLSEIRSNEEVSLNSAGWVDRPRGIVRLPIDTAMQLAAQAWQNPAQARADLIARSQKATAPLPKPAATANPFE
jgi:hypothetical protein